MPPVVAAVAGIATAASGWAAAATLASGVTAAGVVGGLMVAGGAMTAIGAITGNKKLQKWGGIVSLVGGVGNLAMGLADSIATAASAAGSDAAQMASNLTTAPGGADVLAAQDAALGSIGNSANAGLVAPMEGAGSVAENFIQTPGLVNPSQGIAGPAVTPNAVSSTAQQTAISAPGGASVTTSASGGGLLQTVKDGASWLEQNPRLAQMGSGLLKGGLESYAQSEAMKDKIRMEEEAQQRARDRLNASVIGVKVPTYQPPQPAIRG